MDRCMYVWVDVCMGGCIWMDGIWVNEWMDGWMDRWLYGWVGGCMDEGLVGGCMDGWMYVCMDGWVDVLMRGWWVDVWV